LWLAGGDGFEHGFYLAQRPGADKTSPQRFQTSAGRQTPFCWIMRCLIQLQDHNKRKGLITAKDSVSSRRTADDVDQRFLICTPLFPAEFDDFVASEAAMLLAEVPSNNPQGRVTA
jgi:hypothetical protein